MPGELDADAIRILQIDLCAWRKSGATVLERMLDQCYSRLNDAERLRAGRLKEGLPRQEFVVGRGSLRRLIGPAPIEFNEFGKPHANNQPLHFNVAHSRGMVLVAVSPHGHVGVDVEYIDPSIDLTEVLRDALHAQDADRISGMPGREQQLGEFYRCWTAREAILKCDGRGLTVGPEEFAIGNIPPTGSTNVALGRQRFYVRPLQIKTEYRAAIAEPTSPSSERPLQVVSQELSPAEPGWFDILPC